jgi:hypothetical protein
MIEFLQTWAPWILLAGVFAAMHWFGFGCCSARRPRHGTTQDREDAPGESKRAAKGKRAGGCH